MVPAGVGGAGPGAAGGGRGGGGGGGRGLVKGGKEGGEGGGEKELHDGVNDRARRTWRPSYVLRTDAPRRPLADRLRVLGRRRLLRRAHEPPRPRGDRPARPAGDGARDRRRRDRAVRR